MRIKTFAVEEICIYPDLSVGIGTNYVKVELTMLILQFASH